MPGSSRTTPDEATPLQRELDRTGKILGLVVVAIAVVMIVTIVVVEDVRGAGALFDVLILGVALAVAAVPEGLPAVVTAVLVDRRAAHGAAQRHRQAPGRRRDARLGHRHRVGQDRHAHEERDDGARGRHRERTRHLRRSGYAPHGRGAGATDGRPIDGPLRVEARARARGGRPRQQRRRFTSATADGPCRAIRPKARCWWRRGSAGLELRSARRALPRVGEVPFSSERKLMSTLHRDTRAAGSRHRLHEGRARRAAGAMHARARRRGAAAAHAGTARGASCETNEALAGQALRTLGVAGRWLTGEALAEHAAHPDERVEQDLVFAGLIGIIDPPRPEAKEAVARARARRHPSA